MGELLVDLRLRLVDGGDDGARLGVGEHAQLAEELEGHHAVEAGCRLIQEEQDGLGEKLHRHAGALALAAGHALEEGVADVHLLDVGDAHGVGHLRDALDAIGLGAGLGHAKVGGEQERLEDGHVGAAEEGRAVSAERAARWGWKGENMGSHSTAR